MNVAEIVKLDTETAQRLALLAEARGVTPDEYLRDLLLEHACARLKQDPLFFLPKMVECHPS